MRGRAANFPPRLIDALSAEFGRCLLTDDQGVHPDDVRRREDFFTAPAWKARRQWVARHPRLAKAIAARDVSPLVRLSLRFPMRVTTLFVSCHPRPTSRGCTVPRLDRRHFTGDKDWSMELIAFVQEHCS
jgi:hypothetical protein